MTTTSSTRALEWRCLTCGAAMAGPDGTGICGGCSQRMRRLGVDLFVRLWGTRDWQRDRRRRQADAGTTTTTTSEPTPPREAPAAPATKPKPHRASGHDKRDRRARQRRRQQERDRPPEHR